MLIHTFEIVITLQFHTLISKRLQIMHLLIVLSILLPSVAYAYIYQQQNQTVSQTILKRHQPATIATSSVATATRLETQRAIWRNPRGLEYYYAIVQDGTNGLRLYKSSGGSTWSRVSTLSTDTTMSSSVYPYDDGTQLIVYVTYSDGGAWSSNRPVYYRRLLIQDNASDPIIGAEQNTGKGGVHAVIARDRNGFIHIVMWGDGTNRDRITIFGTTTTNPGDAPSWSNTQSAISHSGSSAVDDSAQIVVFDSGNLLGIIANRRSARPNNIDGIDVASFNGATYTMGTDTLIDTGSTSSGYRPFNAVVDSNGIVHLAVHNARTGSVGLRYFKASASNTVQSWNAAETVDSTAPESVAMSIDKTTTPNKLYLFYAKGSTSLIYWRNRAVNASTWSAESNFDDGQGAALDWIQVSNVLTAGTIPVMYTKQTSPYTARFNAFIPP